MKKDFIYFEKMEIIFKNDLNKFNKNKSHFKIQLNKLHNLTQ